MPVRATKRGAERTPLSGSLRRPDLRRELRRAGRRARARRQRRARARDRPLRDRRAPDVRVRRADRVAREPRPRRLDPPDVRRARHPHARARTFRWQLPCTFSTFDYRDAVRAAARPGRRATFETAKVDGTHAAIDRRTPTAATCARRSSSTRSAGAACCRAPSPGSSRPTRGCRAGWRSTPPAAATTSSCGSTPPTCARATRGASRPATSCASASARSTRATTSRSRRCAWPATVGCRPMRYQGNWIPHQMRRRDRGRRLLRRRQRRPLPADDRRGHPHRALLRPGLRARAARRRRGPPGPRAGARPLRRLLRRAPPRRSAGCCGCRPRLAREPDAR